MFKVLLRLLITAAIVVGIGFGVYWIFFTVPDDLKVFEEMSELFTYYEQENIEDSLDSVFSESGMPAQAQTLSQENSKIKNVVYAIYPSVLADGGSYVSTLSVHTYNLASMKYYYRLVQFAESVDSDDVKDIRNLISNQKSTINEYKKSVEALKNFQTKIYSGRTEAQVSELANYYENAKNQLDNVLKVENDISSALRDFVTKYVMSTGMDNDAKGAMLDLLIYANSSAVRDTANQTQLLRDSKVIYDKYCAYDQNNFLEASSTDFLSAYKTLKTAGLFSKIMGVSTVVSGENTYTKATIAQANETSASILNNIGGINSDFFDEVYTVYTYLGF